MLWPALLAPFWALGMRDEAIVWAAWALSFAALGGLAWEAAALTSRLAGRVAAVGAGAMTIAFGGFVWCAASGMEVVPFAWAIARAVAPRVRVVGGGARGALGPPRPRARGARVGRRALPARGRVAALFVAATLAVFPTTATRGAHAHLRSAAAAAVIATPLLLVGAHRLGPEQHGRS